MFYCFFVLVFQILIGILATVLNNSDYTVNIQFQILIGILATLQYKQLDQPFQQFQILIGILATHSKTHYPSQRSPVSNPYRYPSNAIRPLKHHSQIHRFKSLQVSQQPGTPGSGKSFHLSFKSLQVSQQQMSCGRRETGKEYVSNPYRYPSNTKKNFHASI